MEASTQALCPDCQCNVGHTHNLGCTVEPCPVCQDKWLTCGCDKHHRIFDLVPQLLWTGELPVKGVVETVIDDCHLGDVILIALEMWSSVKIAYKMWDGLARDSDNRSNYHGVYQMHRDQFVVVASLLGWPVDDIMLTHDAGCA